MVAPAFSAPDQNTARLADPALRDALLRYAWRRLPPAEVDDLVQNTLTDALASSGSCARATARAWTRSRGTRSCRHRGCASACHGCDVICMCVGWRSVPRGSRCCSARRRCCTCCANRALHSPRSPRHSAQRTATKRHARALLECPGGQLGPRTQVCAQAQGRAPTPVEEIPPQAAAELPTLGLAADGAGPETGAALRRTRER
jgi:hypothetical protein